ncbi:hypothetical protein SDC9_207779 [bioreactor metagenome]|uniref:Glycoside hydrolase family 2 catalytic domain-containing protein n=1 Tax=bioreactor metagenome TaxID=1076179 RepID=A0A645J9F2_9ZZZZ
MIVDQDTVLLRNGKPFFPLGIYHVSGKGQELENAADLGFNLFQFWSWDVNADNLKRLAAKDVGIIWEGQAWGRAARIPSATSANDPRVLAELEIMRKAAAELKDNPTLAMWYVADEPPASQLPVLR